MADTHAALEAHPEIFFDASDQPTLRTAGGYALLASAIQRERSAAPHGSLLVNVGDTIHGSAVAEWTQGRRWCPSSTRSGSTCSSRAIGRLRSGLVFRRRMRELILGAHTHERTTAPVLDGGTPVIQAGSEGSFLARVVFRVQGGKVVGYDHTLLEVTPERYQPNPEVAALVAEARRPFEEKLRQVVGHAETTLFRKGVLESSMDRVFDSPIRCRQAPSPKRTCSTCSP